MREHSVPVIDIAPYLSGSCTAKNAVAEGVKAPPDFREAIAFVVQPNYDATIACIPTCRRTGEAPRHPATTAWEYLHAKLSRMPLETNQ